MACDADGIKPFMSATLIAVFMLHISSSTSVCLGAFDEPSAFLNEDIAFCGSVSGESLTILSVFSFTLEPLS